MKAILDRRHPSGMRVTSGARSAWDKVGVLALALAGCVIGEELTAQGDEATTGGEDAETGRPDVAHGTSTGGGEGPSATGPDRDTATVGGDTGESTSGGMVDVPDPTTGGTSAGPMVFGEDCCAPSEGVGCGDPVVESCVCEADPYCCDSAWDDVCVDLMQDLGCLSCTRGGNSLVPGSCCSADYGQGCIDPVVSDCVCAVDPFCCDVQWDEMCVSLVDDSECGNCQPPPCCAAVPAPGCADDPAIEACVCASDTFCCDEQWDNVCVNEVQSLACGECTYVSQGGDCCTPNGTPGCDDPTVESCVCPGDPFCCQTSWDTLCVDEVDSYGCSVCPGAAGTGSGSGTGGSGGPPMTTGSSETG